MFDALTYQKMLEDIERNIKKYGILNDSIGILITRPDLPTGKNILESLEYYHYRTGKSINFYLPGYGAYWTKKEYPDRVVVTKIAGVEWSFSSEKFVNFIEDMECNSSWEYSGESELLLIELKSGKLSYENVIEFYLDNMIRDKAIISIQEFFEKLFKICKDENSMKRISNTLGLDKAKQIATGNMMNSLPASIGEIFKQEKYFCTRNLQKR